MFRTVLVAIDLEHGEPIQRILRAAEDIAISNACDMHLLNVVAAAPAIVSQFLHENYEQMAAGQAEAELAKLAAGIDLRSGTVSCSIRFGTVYEEVLAAAEAVSAGLIVTGSHKSNVSDYLLGSAAARIVRHARCSVMVIR